MIDAAIQVTDSIEQTNIIIRNKGGEATTTKNRIIVEGRVLHIR